MLDYYARLRQLAHSRNACFKAGYSCLRSDYGEEGNEDVLWQLKTAGTAIAGAILVVRVGDVKK